MSPIDANTLQSRIERAASQVLDDERWRTDLTDDEARPLLRWALGHAKAIALGTSDLADGDVADEFIGSHTAKLRADLDLLAQSIAAFREGAIERFVRLIDEAAGALGSTSLRSRADEWVARRQQMSTADLAREIADSLTTAS